MARSKLPVRKRLKLVPNTTAEQVHRPVDNSTLHVLQDLARSKQRLRLAPSTAVILYHYMYTMKFSYTVLLVRSLTAQTNAAVTVRDSLPDATTISSDEWNNSQLDYELRESMYMNGF